LGNLVHNLFFENVEARHHALRGDFRSDAPRELALEALTGCAHTSQIEKAKAGPGELIGSHAL
jgi:hypothetical protein